MNAKNSVRRKLTALMMALLTGLAAVVGAPQASAANRDWLRPDSTGHCEWDRVGFWVQRCTVWSPAMNRHITVQIQPAQRGGNAGLYMLDGLRATEITNAWVNDVNAARTFKDNNITLVMPVGGQSSFYTDWNAPATYDFNHPVTYKWDTFLTKELPPYLQQHFGVSPTNNSILGLSMGGTAAINLALALGLVGAAGLGTLLGVVRLAQALARGDAEADQVGKDLGRGFFQGRATGVAGQELGFRPGPVRAAMMLAAVRGVRAFNITPIRTENIQYWVWTS